MLRLLEVAEPRLVVVVGRGHVAERRAGAAVVVVAAAVAREGAAVRAVAAAVAALVRPRVGPDGAQRLDRVPRGEVRVRRDLGHRPVLVAQTVGPGRRRAQEAALALLRLGHVVERRVVAEPGEAVVRVRGQLGHDRGAVVVPRLGRRRGVGVEGRRGPLPLRRRREADFGGGRLPVDQQVRLGHVPLRAVGDGRQGRAQGPEAPLLRRRPAAAAEARSSVMFHSFRLIFGRAIISRSALGARILSQERSRAEHSR